VTVITLATRWRSLSAARRLGGVQPRQEQGELLAAEAADQVVAVAYLRPQGVGDPAQHVVSDQVSIGVVDPLEVVDVDQQHRCRLAVSAGRGQLGRRLPFPRDSIEQPSFGVCAGSGVQLGVEHAALCPWPCKSPHWWPRKVPMGGQ